MLFCCVYVSGAPYASPLPPPLLLYGPFAPHPMPPSSRQPSPDLGRAFGVLGGQQIPSTVYFLRTHSYTAHPCSPLCPPWGPEFHVATYIFRIAGLMADEITGEVRQHCREAHECTDYGRAGSQFGSLRVQMGQFQGPG